MGFILFALVGLGMGYKNPLATEWLPLVNWLRAYP